MANICRSLRKKFFFSPVLKSPTHIGFIGVKKNGSKISHLGTFKVRLCWEDWCVEGTAGQAAGGEGRAHQEAGGLED